MRHPIPGHPFYEITETGEVYRVGGLVPLRACPAKRGGYLQVSIWEYGKGKTTFVHQLVAKTFHGPRPSPRHHAAHRNGDKLINTPTNVEWITKEENEADKIAHGRTNRGERNGSARLTDKQASEIRARAALLPRSSGGARIKKGALDPIAREYGISPRGLRNIIFNRRRMHAQ